MQLLPWRDLVHLLDKKETSPEELDLIRKEEVQGVPFLFDFSKPTSLDLRVSMKTGVLKDRSLMPITSHNYQSPIWKPCKGKTEDSLISMRFFPGKIRELEGANEHNESFKESGNLTACFLFDKYAVLASKVNTERSGQHV